MSSIAKKFLMASLIYLILGLVAQTVASFDVWLGFNPLAYTTTIAIEKLLLMGWLAQLALALVYDRWRQPAHPRQANLGLSSKGDIAVFTLFNLGLPLIILGQPGVALQFGAWAGALAVLGSLLQLLAGLIFLWEVRGWLKTVQ